MEFSKESFYADELRNIVTNKLKVCIANSGKLQPVERPLQYCDSCNFPLLQKHCRFCHSENPTKQLDNILASEYRNMRFQTHADTTAFGTQKLNGNRPCYILCVDISGSMKCAYLAPEGYKRAQTQKIIDTIGLDAFRHLSCYISEEEILRNLEMLVNLYQCGETHEDIIGQYFNSKVQSQEPEEMELDKGIDAYITRKEIIMLGVRNFLETLSVKDPEATVYIVYFNNKIHVPAKQFEGYHTIQEIDCKFPQEMFEMGKNYASSIPVGPIIKEKDKILDNFSKITAEGQTALGPALVFCFGLASVLRRPIHQIIIITDGFSNVGFGNIENEEPGYDTKAFYEDITLKYGILNSCIVNLIGFSDQKIGFDKLSEIILKTYGSASLVKILESPNTENKATSQSIENMYKEFNSYIERIQNCCYQTRFSLVAEDPNIKLQPSPTQVKLQWPRPPQFSFCLAMILGIVSPNKPTEVIFQGILPPQTSSLKFSLAIDFVYRGIRYFIVHQMPIGILKGNKKQVQDELIKSLEQQIQSLKLKADVEEYNRVQPIVRQNQHLITQDALADFAKEMEKLRIQQEELEKAVGKDQVVVQKLKCKQ